MEQPRSQPHLNHHLQYHSQDDSSSDEEDDDEVSEDEVTVYHNNNTPLVDFITDNNIHDNIIIPNNHSQHRSQVHFNTNRHHQSPQPQFNQEEGHSRSESFDETEKRTFVRLSSATPSTNSSNHSFSNNNQSNTTSSTSDHVVNSCMPCPPVILSVAAGQGPLGIQIIPFCDASKGGHHNGMVIESIQSGSRIDRDGRFDVDDWIIEVNGRSLLGCSFETAQQRFREELLRFPEVNLKVIKKRVGSASSSSNNNQNNCIQVSSSQKSSASKTNKKSGSTEDDASKTEVKCTKVDAVTCSPASSSSSGNNNTMNKTTNSCSSLSSNSQSLPNSCSSPMIPSSTPLTHASWNTSKIGKKYHIRIQKQESGLGFTITTRDNPAAGNNAGVYVKTILPRGPAIADGRIKQGDRLLEVNGVPMTGKTQEEAVDFLKSILIGAQVDLIVSRQELVTRIPDEDDALPSPSLPREIPAEKTAVEGPSFERQQREVLTFDIPLNDTGSAGLGVSVKGRTQKTNKETNEGIGDPEVVDLGIFVKSVIHGGAASKDGRLKPNDQLISINGIPLLGLSNSDAMETLRRGMMSSNEGPSAIKGPTAIDGHIVLTITRRIPSMSNSSSNLTNGNISLSLPSSPDKRRPKENDNSSLREEDCPSPAQTSVPNLKVRRGSEPTLNMTRIFPDSFLLKTFEAKRWSTAIAVDSRNGEEGYGSDGMEKSSSGQGSTAESSQESTDNNPTPSSTASNTFSRFMRDSGRQSMKEGRLERIRDKHLPGKDEEEDLLQVSSDNDDESTEETTVLNRTDEDDTEVNSDSNFTRDGFGRQSMSEKRHAHLDAKSTDTYQRNKKIREEKKKHGENDSSKHISASAKDDQGFKRQGSSDSDEEARKEEGKNAVSLFEGGNRSRKEEQWSPSLPSESRGRSTLFAVTSTTPVVSKLSSPGRSSLGSRQRSKSSGPSTDSRKPTALVKDAEQFEQTTNKKMTRNRNHLEDDLVTPAVMTPSSSSSSSRTPKTAIKTLFSPKVCCWNCKSSPGGCPYHSSVKQAILNAETNPKLAMTMAAAGRMPHYQMQQQSDQNEEEEPQRSSSMENLDLMMQDLQRIQLESSINAGHHHNHQQLMNASYARPNNVRVARVSRATNESFRAAVDRSYDASGDEVIEVSNNMETGKSHYSLTDSTSLI